MIRIVVQPHTDDAYLSLHSHMLKWIKNGDDVTIITCWAGKRLFEAEHYAQSIGAKHVSWWGDQEHHPDYIEAPAGEGPALSMSSTLPGYFQPGEQVYLPLGIQHSEHRTVAKAFQPCLYNYYLDTPYYAKTTRHDEVNALMQGKEVESLMAPSGRKYKEKFYKIFKTQSMFFHYNLEKLRGLPEIIVRNR